MQYELNDISEFLKNSKITYTFSDKCPISVKECPDLDDAFQDTNLNILIREGREMASCLGCYVDKSEDRIHISASCSANISRKKGYNSFLRIILFYYAIENGIRYITADTNTKSRPLIEKYLNADCSDDYIEPFYDNNCTVDTDDTNTRIVVERNLMKLINKFTENTKSKSKTKSKTNTKINSKTKTKTKSKNKSKNKSKSKTKSKTKRFKN